MSTALFLILLPAVEVVAQTRPESTNYQIPADVVPSGGGEGARSTNYILNDTIGEANIGPSESDLYALDAGYRQTVADSFLSLSCPSTTDLGTVSFRGQANGEMDCTVTTDNEAGYSLSWRSGVPTSNLVGHWKLDEASGTTAVDSSGNGNNGTVNGATVSTGVYSPHHSVRSRDFDGSNDYIQTNPGVIGNGSKTISLWVKTTDSHPVDSHAALVSKFSSNLGTAFIFWVFNGSVFWGDSNSQELGWSGGEAYIEDGVWHHLVAVRDGSNGYIYADGVLKASETGTFSDTASTAAIEIGAYYNGSTPGAIGRYGGMIDDVRIYNSALSLAEIQQLASKKPVIDMASSGSTINSIPAYNFPSTGGLVGHWRMEETVGGDSVLDWSGLNNDGTPTGASGANNKPQPSTDVPTGVNHATSRSMDFDGTDDYVDFSSLGTSFMNPPDASSFTVMAWAKGNETPTAVSSSIIGSTNIGSLGYGWWLGWSGESSVRFFVSQGAGNGYFGSNPTATVSNPLEWHHYAGTWNGSQTKLYVDGILVATDNYSGSYAATSSNFMINNALNSWDSQIDDVRIFNRALSAEEIKALYGTPQTWSVGANSVAWGARLTSGSDDTDAKWGTDASSETWLHVGDGDYPVVSRASRTDVDGSAQTFDFRAEVGSTAIVPSGAYNRTVVMTAAGL